MDYIIAFNFEDNELYHHGIKLQKWGLRRWQNPDGSLTEAGKIRYSKYKTKESKKSDKKWDKQIKKAKLSKDEKAEAIAVVNKLLESNAIKNMTFEQMLEETSKLKKAEALSAGLYTFIIPSFAGIPATILTNYNTYKNEISRNRIANNTYKLYGIE